MAFIPVPNGIQFCFNFQTAGQNWQFCLMLKKSAGAPTPTDLATVVALGRSWWTSDFKPNFTSETSLATVTATDMTVQGGPQAVDSSASAGTASAGTMPMNAAVVVSLRTAKRGRSYRGRYYIGAIPLAQSASAIDVNGSYATALGADFVTLAASLDAAGFDIVVASRQHNGVVTNPAETNEVIAFVINNQFDSQRRRLAGRGT